MIVDINSPITRIVIIACMIVLLTLSLFAVREMENEKEGAKTAYTMSGESISKKVIAKLANQCKFTFVVMSSKKIKAMKIAKLTKQLAKLSSK